MSSIVLIVEYYILFCSDNFELTKSLSWQRQAGEKM